MSNKVFKFMFLMVLAGTTAFMSGCKSKNPNTGLYGSDAGLYGDPLLGDVPLEGDSGDWPADGDRSLFDAVYFAYDSSQVNPEEAGKCEAVAKHLNKGKGQGVIVEGHTDERGSHDYNLALGERRALAVRDYLISLGVDPSVIQTKSYGEEMPDSAGHDEGAWRLNRRSVFAIY
ncbi:OmpA family protein [Pontiella sulfatireligans]|uniref:Peptidoglycan-associated lipoprotein n=1 Tax=Pontiella sulfatireligans TaxID=2750658 RepID=A0A6C2URG4_9BACT|nr:OmpA family protein [Pontiella sulfatireligans]VGO21817.1 Outer membrane protein P6 [Pontiella sulfatireligans]